MPFFGLEFLDMAQGVTDFNLPARVGRPVAEMDADAPVHAAFGRGLGIPLCREPLQPQSAFDGADHGAKLD